MKKRYLKKEKKELIFDDLPLRKQLIFLRQLFKKKK